MDKEKYVIALAERLAYMLKTNKAKTKRAISYTGNETYTKTAIDRVRIELNKALLELERGE